MAEPRVSVVMSVYNGERFLREAVESILAQTFTDFEFIIIDDGSTDSTRSILESYDDPRIALVHQENMGLTCALNRAFGMARGDFIARMDADDVSKPERFEKQVEFMDAHPESAILGGQAEAIDSSGRVLSRWFYPTSRVLLKWRLVFGNQFVHSSVMLRRSFLGEHALTYDERFVKSQDYDLWDRMAEKGCVANLPEVLISRRVHAGAITVHAGDIQEKFAGEVTKRTIERYLGREVTDGEVSVLRMTPSMPRVALGELSAIGDLLAEITLCYIGKNALQGGDREAVKRDVLEKWTLLLRSQGAGWVAGLSMLRAFKGRLRGSDTTGIDPKSLIKRLLGERGARAAGQFLVPFSRGLTIRQRYNILLSQVFGARERPPYGPDAINIYLTDRCNLKCWHCRQSTDECYDGSGNEMSFDLYKKILKRFAGSRTVSLTGFGEPLLHKDVFKFASYARNRYGMKTVLLTNGVLSKRFVSEICDNFDNVSVSIHGLDGEDFVRVTGAPRETFDDFVEGVSLLASCFVDAGRGDCLRASCLINRENFKSAERCTELVKSLGIKNLDLHNFISYTEDEYEQILYDSDTEIFDWLCDLQKRNKGSLKIELPTPIKREPGKLRRSCNSYFKLVGVDHNGLLTGCRRFLPPDSSFGHFDDPDAWRNEKFREMRRTFIDKNAECKDFCRHCVDCQ